MLHSKKEYLKLRVTSVVVVGLFAGQMLRPVVCFAEDRDLGTREVFQESPEQKTNTIEEQKKPQLTPIIPSPNDMSKPAYQLYVETDLPILGLALTLELGRLIKTQSAYCAPLCNPRELNPIDRLTAGFYDTGWSTSADIAIFALGGAAMGLLFLDEGFWPGLNDIAVVAEAALIASSFSGLATLAVNRPRPFLYTTKAPLAKRLDPEGGLSFISGHAAVGFAIAVSTYITMTRLHPSADDPLPWIALAVGLAGMSFVSLGRVLGGNHFITDTLAGAVIGSAFGVLIPALHKSPIKVLPSGTSVTLLTQF